MDRYRHLPRFARCFAAARWDADTRIPAHRRDADTRTPAGPRAGLRASATIIALLLAVSLILGAVSGCSSDTQTAAQGLRAAEGLRVLPFPGTPDASPLSEVTFMSVAPADLVNLTIIGSESGVRSGRLEVLPNGGGAAFVPDDPYVAGEQVSVSADLASDSAAAAVGVSSDRRMSFSFTVALPAGDSAATTTTTAPAGSQGAGGQDGSGQGSGGSTTTTEAPPPTWSFQSRPDLHPPEVDIPVADQDPDAGLIFLDAHFAPQYGPLILDAKGNVVWFRGLPSGTWGMNLQVQTYQGEPVLTWWEGNVDATGHGTGQGIIVDTSYTQVATVKAGWGYQADLHEFLLTPRGTVWITVYQPIKADLTAVGGEADGALWDSMIQEVDVPTGRVLWEWHALGHIPLQTCAWGKPPERGTVWDFFHINSIQETPEGDLIVSARNTWAVYRISRATGKVEWQLGGQGNSFGLGKGVRFEFQHDARLRSDGTLTLFNNASSPKQEDESRGMIIKLDTSGMVATLVSSFPHDPPLSSGSQGSVQLLPNGNWFVGWGDQPNFTEFEPDGSVVFDGKFPGAVQSYRAFRAAWSARPAENPAVVLASDTDGKSTVYVSWNGATDVDRWELLGGPDSGSAAPVASAPANGFETALPADSALAYLAVRALDASGKVLATVDVPR